MRSDYVPIPALSDARIAKIWSHIKRGPTCWEWQGSRNRDGYGVVRLGGRKGRSFLVHRVVFRITYGRDPVGGVLHTCDNPPCCRPDHLFEGDQAVNNRDSVRKGRGNYPRWRKLNDREIREILALRGVRTQLSLAAEFGVSRSTIQLIQRGIRRPLSDKEDPNAH